MRPFPLLSWEGGSAWPVPNHSVIRNIRVPRGINSMEDCQVFGIVFTTHEVDFYFHRHPGLPRDTKCPAWCSDYGHSESCVMAPGKHPAAVDNDGTSLGAQVNLLGHPGQPHTAGFLDGHHSGCPCLLESSQASLRIINGQVKCLGSSGVREASGKFCQVQMAFAAGLASLYVLWTWLGIHHSGSLGVISSGRLLVRI